LPIAAKVIHRAGPLGSNTTFSASFNVKTGLVTTVGLFTSDAALSPGRVEAPQLLPVVAMVFVELAARVQSSWETLARPVTHDAIDHLQQQEPNPVTVCVVIAAPVSDIVLR
jgi:hypothetical protein